MGIGCDGVKLYSLQTQTVLDVLFKDGVCFSKEEYVKKKYGESAKIFLTAYRWFVGRAGEYMKKPEGAEFPYWAFRDLYSLEASPDNPPLVLLVPKDEAVFFDMYDWNKIMQLRYMGEDEKDEKEFRKELSMCGLDETKIMLTDFYPDWKEKIYKSWDRLFRHHEAIKKGDLTGIGSVQAGLWQIKKEWILNEGGEPAD